MPTLLPPASWRSSDTPALSEQAGSNGGRGKPHRVAEVPKDGRVKPRRAFASRRRCRMLKPEATIGILGGGQLGRMLALGGSPARLQVPCLLRRIRNTPAFDVVRRVTRADYTDTAALARFAENVDVVTYEFENVPAETATFPSARVPALPDPKILAITQDRLAEKNFVTALGIRTAPFAEVASPAARLPRQSSGSAARPS